MKQPITAHPAFSVEPFSGLNFEGPKYSGYAVIRHEADLAPEIVAVYISAEMAEASAERHRKLAR